MCDKTRLTHSILAKFIALQDIETATFAYNGQIAQAKAAAEAKARDTDQQPWVPDDVFDIRH
jgi:hypothetical protein